MKTTKLFTFLTISGWMIALAVLSTPQAVGAATPWWQAVAGAQSKDLGRQALAFLPNELWVHIGDGITWTFSTDEVHTVTFLKPRTRYDRLTKRAVQRQIQRFRLAHLLMMVTTA